MTITLPSIDDLLSDAPVDHPAATPEQNDLLAWAAAHPIERATVPLNGRRQYHTIHPIDGGKPKGYTRCSTFAGALDDGGGLTVWRHGILMKGIGMRPILAETAALAHLNDDTGTLRSLAATALALGGEKLAADIGTALHLACEWTHEPAGPAKAAAGAAFPASYRPDVAAFTGMLAAHQLTIVAVEQNVFTPGPETVGRFDYLVTGPWGDELRVVDVKTGSKHDRIAHPVQLATLANASHIWVDDAWQPAPAIDKAVAYIAHMPAGTGACDLVSVDIAAAWELVQLSIAVRAARSAKTLRPLFTVLEAPAQLDLGAPVADPIATAAVEHATSLAGDLTAERAAWIGERLAAIAAIDDKRGVEAVRRYWPTDTPARPPWTEAQIDTIDALLVKVEGLDEVPFIATDPTVPDPMIAKRAAAKAALDAAELAAQQAPTWPTPDNGIEIPGEQIAPLTAHVATLPDAAKQLAAAWSAEGKLQQRPWGRTVDGKWSERTFAINLAAMSCIEHLYDDDSPSALTRAALSLVIAEDVQPSWQTGAVLGALTIAEATRLDAIARDFGSGDATTTAQLGAVVTRVA